MPRMAPAVSALARQTMTTAFEDLERTISPADAREMRSLTAMQEVRAACLDIENQLAARQALRNMRRLVPLLNGLEHYAKVVDILCNGTPLLPWIWSPITLILRVASEYIEAFEHIMRGYARIADALGRFSILSNAFISDADFQNTLAAFYADILKFHKQAYKFVRRNSWKLLFLTSWGRFQGHFENILEDLDRHGDLVDREANARNVSEARKLRHDILLWKEESRERLRQDDERQDAKQYQSIISWMKCDETEQISIFEAISEEGAKFPGTCTWGLRNDKISSWLKRRPDSQLTWLQGSPGSGKSVMSTQLLNFLHASRSTILHHFCTQSYASSTRYESIMKGLLLQLLRVSGDLTAYTYQEFVVGRKTPTTTNLEQLLQLLLSTLSETGQSDREYIWLLIDSIEECEINRQSRLVAFLNQITSSSSTSGGTVCKVLVTSRAYPTRLKRIWKVVSIADEKDEVEKAIQLYASQRLREIHERLRQLELDAEEVEAIERMIAKKAHGMFLYARLILNYVSANLFSDGDELRDSINQLPQELAELYHRILAQILAQKDARSVDRIRRIFSWIAFSKRPLKKLELLSALSFGSGNADATKPWPSYFLDICGPLVEERRDTTFGFIHVSVKEFLQSSSVPVALKESDALREHGISTMTCLLSGFRVFDTIYEEQTRVLRLIKGVHGFHVYATEYWTEYLLSNAASGSLEAAPGLLVLATQLTRALDKWPSATMIEGKIEGGASDDRLRFLERHPVLQKHVTWALLARSQRRIEAEILQQSHPEAEDASKKIAFLDGVSKILDAYQISVEKILDMDSCPGASAEQLELFKNQFRSSAYTCRLRSCPRATLGFNSAQLRHEHEMGHAGGFRCSYLGCHYPPFRTSQSLKVHVDRDHAPVPARKSIRRVGQLGTSDNSTLVAARSAKASSQPRTVPPHYLNSQWSQESRGNDLNQEQQMQLIQDQKTNERGKIEKVLRQDHQNFRSTMTQASASNCSQKGGSTVADTQAQPPLYPPPPSKSFLPSPNPPQNDINTIDSAGEQSSLGQHNPCQRCLRLRIKCLTEYPSSALPCYECIAAGKYCSFFWPLSSETMSSNGQRDLSQPSGGTRAQNAPRPKAPQMLSEDIAVPRGFETPSLFQPNMSELASGKDGEQHLDGGLLNGAETDVDYLISLSAASASPPNIDPPQFSAPLLASNYPSVSAARNETEPERRARAQKMLQEDPRIISKMEHITFPLSMFSSQTCQAIPPFIKTWAQLKKWRNQNETVMLGVDHQALELLQVLHFKDIMRKQHQQEETWNRRT